MRYEQFSINLSNLRIEKGLSQYEFSREIHKSLQSIKDWESGKIPNGKSLMDLSDYFNVSIDELLGRITVSTHVSVEGLSLRDVKIVRKMVAEMKNTK